jgi:hypothetical protein
VITPRGTNFIHVGAWEGGSGKDKAADHGYILIIKTKEAINGGIDKVE